MPGFSKFLIVLLVSETIVRKVDFTWRYQPYNAQKSPLYNRNTKFHMSGFFKNSYFAPRYLKTLKFCFGRSLHVGLNLWDALDMCDICGEYSKCSKKKMVSEKSVLFISLQRMFKNSKTTADSLPTRPELSNDVLNVHFTQTDEKLPGGVKYYPPPPSHLPPPPPPRVHLVVKECLQNRYK